MSLLVKGQLKESQVENLASDPTNLPHGRIWFNTALSRIKASISGVARIILTETSVGSSSVTLTVGNGFGTTNTKIRRFTTSSVVGTNLTYTSSATNGDSITINKAGLYSIVYGDNWAGGINEFGVSLNSTQLNTSIRDITAASRLIFTSSEASVPNTITVISRLAVNDVIRPHASGNFTDIFPYNFFIVTEIVGV